MVLVLTGCSGSNIPVSSGCTTCGHKDGGTPDAGRGGSDAGADAGPDGGPGDAGADGGVSDAGVDGGALDAGLPLTGQVCPTGALTFSGEVIDLCQTEAVGSDVPIDGVQVATLQPYGATVSADGGRYALCIPPGVPTTMVFSAAQYVTLFMPEIILTPGGLPLGNDIGRIRLPCTSALQTYASELPNLDTRLPMVYVQIDSASNQPPCGTKDAGTDAGPSPFSGWTITAELADDGGLADGGAWPIGYFDASDDLQSVTSTFLPGQALVYNIDPGADYIVVEASNARLSAICTPLNADLGVDGRIHVAPNSVSVYPWIVP